MLAAEKLLGIEVPRRGQLIRVLYSEIGRLLSHLLQVTTQALDVGALTPIACWFRRRPISYDDECNGSAYSPSGSLLDSGGRSPWVAQFVLH